VEIDYLDPVAPRVAEIAAKPGQKLDPIAIDEFLADSGDLFFIAHHDAEMAVPLGPHLVDAEDGEELMFAELEEGVAFALVEFLEIENVLIKRDRFLDVIDFDGDVVAAVNLNLQEPIPLFCEQRLAGFRAAPASLRADPAMLHFRRVTFTLRPADFARLDAGA
jgi:hypothetical protein